MTVSTAGDKLRQLSERRGRALRLTLESRGRLFGAEIRDEDGELVVAKLAADAGEAVEFCLAVRG
jgi:hypothetical protein